MTPTQTPVVPPLRSLVSGRWFGGQYWNDTEFEYVLDQSPDGDFTLGLHDTGGHLLWSQSIGRTGAEALRTHLVSGALDSVERPLIEGVTGPVLAVCWLLGDPEQHEARLEGGRLVEIADWLSYALGHVLWDGGPDWEY